MGSFNKMPSDDVTISTELMDSSTSNKNMKGGDTFFLKHISSIFTPVDLNKKKIYLNRVLLNVREGSVSAESVDGKMMSVENAYCYSSHENNNDCIIPKGTKTKLPKGPEKNLEFDPTRHSGNLTMQAIVDAIDEVLGQFFGGKTQLNTYQEETGFLSLLYRNAQEEKKNGI